MQNLIVFLTAIILAAHLQYIFGVPVGHENDASENMKRSDEKLLPSADFSLVTNEKLLKLKELASVVHDPKLNDLYRAVDHYVHIARKNNEHVMWKYDANQEGLVLTLKPNLNGILYYG